MTMQMSRVAVTPHVGLTSDVTAGTSPTSPAMVAPGGTGPTATLDPQSDAEVAGTGDDRSALDASASDPSCRDGEPLGGGGSPSRPTLRWFRGRMFGQPHLPRRWTWIVTFAGFHTLALWTITPRIWR